ncbi:phosphatidate cytidylyltransferase [Tropicimonas sp. IMCC34011]|uniref:phosphatidate cytidylyltransferase n=1 Tax=Tropicimonas sp. IMCC34011 TaxID=2248759 RepID=UPI002100DF06|nr:phosphatidate cytidylyltransferase [Tropicimonas sp. IMCC34011]
MPDPSAATTSRWNDLRDRAASSAAMVVIGIFAVHFGGVWFQMLTVFVTAILMWELARMIRPESIVFSMMLAAGTASILSGLLGTQEQWFLLLIFLPAILGTFAMSRERLTFFCFAVMIVAAGWGLVSFRDEYGGIWLYWLILVVIATDVLGYFAGKSIGGPKFWPRVSPKKTWSGTAAGWIGAGLVGALFLVFTDAGWGLVWVSMLLSLASQMGDIAESALKRRMGVKDSSALIPGHGGLFDRFDGLLGASLFLLVIALFVDIPRVDL